MFSKSKRFVSPNPECPNAFYTYDSQLSNRKASFGYGNKSDFTRTLTVSPPVTKYEIKTFLDESKEKGKSFGLTREKLPDNSYLVPQLQKVPGPGLVSILICSMKTKRIRKETIASLCALNLLISSIRSYLSRNLLDLELTNKWNWCQSKEGSQFRSSQILPSPSFTQKLKDLLPSSRRQAHQLMLKEIP